MLRRERLGAPEDREIALVRSDDRFVCRLILGNSAPVDMDSSIPDYGYRLPCERVSMRQNALLHHRSNLLVRCDLLIIAQYSDTKTSSVISSAAKLSARGQFCEV